MADKRCTYVQNYPLCRIQLAVKRKTQLNESTNQNLTKVSKVVSQRIRKSCYKTLRTSVINSPMSLNSKD